MYTTQKNPAARRSQELICKAMCGLMAEFPFEEITVTRICQEAGVGRKTFYRNYERKEDVVEQMIVHLREEYERELLLVPVEETVRHHFTFLTQRIEFMKLMHSAGQMSLMNARFSELQPKVMPQWSDDERENAYRTAVAVAGTEAVIRLWAERGFRESVEELVQLHRYALGDGWAIIQPPDLRPGAGRRTGGGSHAGSF